MSEKNCSLWFGALEHLLSQGQHKSALCRRNRRIIIEDETEPEELRMAGAGGIPERRHYCVHLNRSAHPGHALDAGRDTRRDDLRHQLACHQAQHAAALPCELFNHEGAELISQTSAKRLPLNQICLQLKQLVTEVCCSIVVENRCHFAAMISQSAAKGLEVSGSHPRYPLLLDCPSNCPFVAISSSFNL